MAGKASTKMAGEMIRNQRSSEHYFWGASCDGWHLVKDPQLSVIYERMPPGTSEARHYHDQAQQFFFVVDGEAVLEVEGKEFTLNGREGIHVLPRQAHRIFNRSASDLLFLIVSQPTSHGDRVNAND